VLLLQFKILLPEGVDTIDHGLDQLDLRVAQTMLVGNVISVTSLSTGLSAGTTGLEVEGLAPGLQSVNAILGPAGQVNVDRGAHASAQVGGAGVDITKLGGQEEVLARFGLDGIADGLDTPGEPFEDSLNIASLLHGDDPKLILLIDPDQEGLVLVVEDTTAFGPVALHTSDLQVGVTGHEKEMVIDELLADTLIHAGQGIVASGEVTLELGEGVLHEGLDVDTLLLGDSGGETESLDGTADTDPSRVNGHIGFDVSGDLGTVHVRGVLKVSRETMVLADEGIENISEVDVRIFISGVHTAMLVIELNGTGNGLGQGEARGLGSDAGKLVPFLLGDVLGDQRVLGLDFRECGHGVC